MASEGGGVKAARRRKTRESLSKTRTKANRDGRTRVRSPDEVVSNGSDYVVVRLSQWLHSDCSLDVKSELTAKEPNTQKKRVWKRIKLRNNLELSLLFIVMDPNQIITRDYQAELLLLYGRLMVAPATKCGGTVFMA